MKYAWWQWLTAAIGAAIIMVMLLAWVSIAQGHEWYGNYSNKNDENCCGGQDCEPIDVDRVIETDTEFIVDDRWHFNKETEAIPSQDGGYHVCIRNGKPRCFFFPLDA